MPAYICEVSNISKHGKITNNPVPQALRVFLTLWCLGICIVVFPRGFWMVVVIARSLLHGCCHFQYCTKSDICFAAKLRYTLQKSQNNAHRKYSTEHSL